jgi:thiol:disulfide interchange protein DsbD
MKADWTKNDETITRALRRFGRSGVPLYVLYGTDPSQPPTLLPQVLTPEVILDYLTDLAKPASSPLIVEEIKDDDR